MRHLISALIIFVSSLSLHAESYDEALRKRLDFFNVKYMEPVSASANSYQIEFGKRLFMDTDLSGNRNISCRNCHNPMMGTSDGLALSQTQNGDGVLKRNSPALFNLGRHQSNMFWDGRVHYDPASKVFTTPEVNLPAEITSVMTSALAAQAIFPLVSMEEMKGNPGENEIADAKNNLEAWQRIVERVKKQTTNGRIKSYSELFKLAFPGTPVEKMTIGHIGEAIAQFESVQFQSTASPFNTYLKGDNNALSDKQKRGLFLFMDKGRCIACHQGSALGNNTFFTSVAVPQMGARPFKGDAGRGDINNETFRKYFFRTPSLLNVGLTAPYMHNGAFETLEEVLNHYNDIKTSLKTFTLKPERRESFPVEVEVDSSLQMQEELWKSIQAPFLRAGLGLTPAEKEDLVSFLNSLTDPKWKVQ